MNPQIIANKAVVICRLFEIICSNDPQRILSWFTDEREREREEEREGGRESELQCICACVCARAIILFEFENSAGTEDAISTLLTSRFGRGFEFESASRLLRSLIFSFTHIERAFHYQISRESDSLARLGRLGLSRVMCHIRTYVPWIIFFASPHSFAEVWRRLGLAP